MTKQLIARAAMIVSIFAAGLLGSGLAFAQNPAIRGKVVDTSNTGVIGAAVLVPGTTNGVQTDLDGNFEIRVAPGTTLEVSCIGYTTKRVSAAANMVVVLEDDAEMLEETVVIGYGVQKKSDLTGSVASVRSEDLQNRSTADAASALQGKAAGVQILNYSGAPGQGAAIRVRGYSSNDGNIGPLLIVDGLKVDNIQYLDPSMIESMEILKDAASAAIYGAQAGNGVVLITTKSGASNNGRTSITYDFKYTIQSLAHLPGVMNREQYIDFKRMQGYDIDGEMVANGDDGVIDTDWSKVLFEKGAMQQHGITFQGGNNSGHFFVSLNYLDNNGIVVGDKDVYKRLSAQINADYQIKKWLQVGTNTSIERWSTLGVNQRSETNSPMMAVIQNDPLTPAYYDDPSQFSVPMTRVWNGQVPAGFESFDPHSLILQAPDGRWYAVSKYVDNDHGSPLIQLARTNSTNSGITVRGSAFVNFTPIKGLVVTSRFGYRLNYSNSHNYSEPYYANDMAKADQYTISAGANTGIYYQWENFANYNFNIGKNAFTVMAGMSYTQSTSDNVSASGSGKDILSGYTENFRYLDKLLPGNAVTRTMSNNPGRSANLSYFGRLSWSYDNRYSLQANFRADAFDSSKLSKRSRWGYFPSVSAGWTISNEPFFKNNIGRNAISFLKIRASWGINGNVNVLNGYKYDSTVTLNGQWYEYGLGSEPSYGSMPSGVSNPDLKWETSQQLDFGLDARFLNNRLTLGVDYYDKNTNGLLVAATLPPEIGESSSTINAGTVNNKGLEVELGWKDTIGDFHYSINGNFSWLKNMVTYLDPSIPRDVSGSYYVSQIRSAFEVGYPIWYMYGYQYDGYDANGAPILHDFSGDGDVTDVDKTMIGSGIPDYTFGLTLNLAWKGLDLTVFGTGVAGNEIFPVLYRTDRPYNNTLEWYHANSWTPERTNAKFPNPALVKNDTKFWASSANVFDGSYFKIKQIQLGYTLPQSLTKKAMINSLRVFVSLDDFFTFTSYPGLDPETATTESIRQMGIDLGTYPTTRKVVFGVNVNF